MALEEADCAIHGRGNCTPLQPFLVHAPIPEGSSTRKQGLLSCLSSPPSYIYQVDKVSNDGRVRLAYFETVKQAKEFIQRHHGDFEYFRVSVPTKHVELTDAKGCVTLTANATTKQVSQAGKYWIK